MAEDLPQNTKKLLADPFAVLAGREFPTGAELARAIDGARELADILSTAPVGKLVVSVGLVRWEVERREAPGTATQSVRAHPVPMAEVTMVEPAPVVTDQLITAPMVGVFYPAPGPGQPTFTSLGARVQDGQQVAIVEAMKMMNAVIATCSGTIASVHVGAGDIVEHGQALFTVQPD
jgi:acetyl-CoA carboxylase biotin carboxyl carrier protein